MDTGKLFKLYIKASMLQANVDVSQVNESEGIAVVAQLNNVVSFEDWAEKYIELMTIQASLETGGAPVKEQEITMEEAAKHNEKVLPFLPKSAQEQIKKKA